MTAAQQRANSTLTSYIHPKSGIEIPVLRVPCADCGDAINMNPESAKHTKGVVRCLSCGAKRYLS